MNKLIVLAFILSSGCASLEHHIQIPEPPSETASLEERSTFFNNYAIDEMKQQTNDTTYLDGRQKRRNVITITLKNGEKLTESTDLLHVVKPESVTAHKIKEYQDSKGKGKWLRRGGLIGLVGGLVLSGNNSESVSSIGTGALIGGGVALVGGIVYGMISKFTGTIDNLQAMGTYNDDLMDRLGLEPVSKEEAQPSIEVEQNEFSEFDRPGAL